MTYSAKAFEQITTVGGVRRYMPVTLSPIGYVSLELWYSMSDDERIAFCEFTHRRAIARGDGEQA